MSFQIPNQASASFARQAAWHSSDIDALVAAQAGDGVLSGLGCSAQGTPDMTVAVAAGQVRVQGYFPYYAGGNATITTADATNPRIDIITISYNGAITVTAGTAASAPVAPSIPANNVLLCQVYVSAGVTAIGSNRIVDKRVAIPDTFDEWDEFTSGALVTTGNISKLAWSFTANGTQALSFLTGTALHPGQLSVGSGATSGNDTRIQLGTTSTAALSVLPTNISRLRVIMQISSVVSTMRFKFGLGTDISDVGSDTFGTDGVWWEFNSNDSNKWQTETRAASTTTTNTDTGADVATTTWYQIEMVRLQNGNWQFAKNGALLFSHSTNLPSAACQIGFVVETNTGSARTFLLDFFGMNLAPLGNRWT